MASTKSRSRTGAAVAGSDRRGRREDFVIRTLKPLTPSSLALQRRLRTRMVAFFPVLVMVSGVVLLGLHSLLPLGVVVLGASCIVVGLMWMIANLSIGSPRRVLRSLSPFVRNHDELEQLMNILEGLCVENGIATPKVRIIDDQACNAIVLGWREQDATLVLTSGLLERCGRIELEGVIAHELAHIKRGDLRDHAFAMVSGGGLALFSRIAYSLVAALIDPAREAQADLGGVSMTRFPPGLVQALLAISSGATRPLRLSKTVAIISAPAWLAGFGGPDQGRSRPGGLDISERIALLAEL